MDIRKEDGTTVDTLLYTLDEKGNSERLYLGRLSWKVITRGGEPYIRSWDDQNPAVARFKPFARYPLTEEFIFMADFQYYDSPRTRTVSTQLGPTETVDMIGELSFDYQGQRYALEVGRGGFTMVGDATTGRTTYGGGRYIDLALPDTSGPVVLDFNRLYNPPCTFSIFTTCQYPSAQNVLPFEIRASEKYSGH